LTGRARADRTARVGVDDQIKKALQDLIAPELHAIRGEMHAIRGEMHAMRADIRVLDQKIDGVDHKIDSLKGELLAEIRRLDARIDGVDRELRTAIDIRERLAALEARRVS
jgi:prefoldin subunit 5